MKLRLLVDSSRQSPAPGELVLLAGEGFQDGTVRFCRAKLQYEAPANFIDALPQWKDVPIELYSMKLEQDKQREASRLAQRKPKGD